MLLCADLSTTVWRVTNELRKEWQVTEDIQAQSVTVTSHHSPSIQMNFNLLINVADTVFLVAMQRVSECLTDVASSERFAGDLSQFGH